MVLAHVVALQKSCGHLAVQSYTTGKTVPKQERIACSRLLLAADGILGALFRSAPLNNDLPLPTRSPLRMCKAMLAEAMEDCGRGEGSDQNELKK